MNKFNVGDRVIFLAGPLKGKKTRILTVTKRGYEDLHCYETLSDSGEFFGRTSECYLRRLVKKNKPIKVGDRFKVIDIEKNSGVSLSLIECYATVVGVYSWFITLESDNGIVFNCENNYLSKHLKRLKKKVKVKVKDPWYKPDLHSEFWQSLSKRLNSSSSPIIFIKSRLHEQDSPGKVVVKDFKPIELDLCQSYIKVKLKENSEKIESLEKNVKNSDANITTLNENFEILEESIDEHESAISEIEDTVDEIKVQIAKKYDPIDYALRDKLENFEKRIKALFEFKQLNKSKIDSIDGIIYRLEQLEKKKRSK